MRCILDFTFYTDGTFEVEGSSRKFKWKLVDDVIYCKYARTNMFTGDITWLDWEVWSSHTDLQPPKPHKIKYRLKKALAEIDDILLGEL
jgi:hypothetical protein